MVLVVPVMTFVVAFNQIFPVVVVVTASVPPVVTEPAVAVTEIPFVPEDCKFADAIVVVVLDIVMSPVAVSPAPIETAPVAGMFILPEAVDAVIVADTVTAAP